MSARISGQRVIHELSASRRVPRAELTRRTKNSRAFRNHFLSLLREKKIEIFILHASFTNEKKKLKREVFDTEFIVIHFLIILTFRMIF